MTTVNYTDVGITSSMITELKKSWRKTGWRLKLLKPLGTKLFDAAAAVTTKIDTNGGSSKYSLNTAGDKYIKMVDDPRHNRTFILHKNPMNTTTTAIVSIINHFLETTDVDYIETINVSTAQNWPAEYTIQTAYDMDYNPDKDELVIALAGTGTVTTNGATLMLIDTQKYAAELVLNTCSTLDDNPDYLTCTMWRDSSGVQDAGQRSYTKYVRYHKGKYWTWSRADAYGASPASEYQIIWQLGWFNATTGAFTLAFQNGWAHDDGDNRPNGDPWPSTVTYPTQARLHPVYTSEGVTTGTVDGYVGDPSNGLLNVTSFEITPEGGGQIIMGTSPDSMSQGFGMEPFIYRISIPVLLTELTAASRLIATDTLVVQATNHAGTYYIDAGFETHTQTGLESMSGGGLITMSASCSMAGCTYMYVENTFGTVATQFTVLGSYVSHASLFIGDEDSATTKFAHPNLGSSPAPFSVTWTISTYKAIPGLVEIIGIHSVPALVRPTDSDRPQTVTGSLTTPIIYPIEVAQRAFPSGVYNCVQDVFYSVPYEKFAIAMRDPLTGSLGRGLYVYLHSYTTPESRALHIYDVAGSDLAYDYIGDIGYLNGGAITLGSNASTPPNYYGDIVALQFFNLFDESFEGDTFTASLGWTAAGLASVAYDTKHNRFGFVTEKGWGTGTGGEIWFYTPPLNDGVWKWSRDIRVWWDGTESDLILGDGSAYGGNIDQSWSFDSPSFTTSKGNTSYQLSLSVSGADYLPWNQDSEFNWSPDTPGNYDLCGMLSDATRVILERGVFLNGVWNWIAEGQFFIEKSPADLDAGITDMQVQAGGPISLLVTRGIYEGTHKPDETVYSRVTLTSTDDLNYIYNDGVSDITDWSVKPAPQIYVDGVLSAAGYTLTSASGMVTFPSVMTGSTITATFTASVPGTNEGEDIILCILRYPQELGGCGLDDSYFTRLVSDDAPTTTDNLTFTCSKNMVVDSDDYNAVYRDGVLQTVGFTWDYPAGTITFAVSQAGHTITANYKHYTIQKSGATLRNISFHPRKQRDSYEAINEVCRRVAPNYIFREGRDGKLECDFFTQKTAALADLTVTDSDIMLNHLQTDPIYEGLATRVISFGSAELDDLPNLCLGKTVTDLWAMGWHAGQNFQNVTDGDPATGVQGGYGRWSEGTYDNQVALIAAGETGLPALSVDMEAVYEVETIIVARTSGAANETTMQSISVDVSNDGSSWVKLVAATEIGPGANVQFKAGTNFDEGTKFQYIRVNIHSLGLYTNSKGDTDSQISISEIQCYQSTTIEGIAVLQDTDPTAELYDSTGLLAKYGIINNLARGGTPDSMLYTQELADYDAKWVLNEIVRLLSKVEIRSPWLPCIPIFSTITVTNAALGIDQTYFIESRTADSGGDVYTGMTLP